MYAAGKNPTRASLMNALLHMNSKNRFALPGVVQTTSPKDHFIFSQMEPQRYGNGAWSNDRAARQRPPALGTEARSIQVGAGSSGPYCIRPR